MTKEIKTGQITVGLITGVQSYGAFVALKDDTKGLIHISEITEHFVHDIHDFLAVGDKVKVKILRIDEESNKASLSIRQARKTPVQSDAKMHQSQSELTISGFQSLQEKLNDWIKQYSN